MWAEILVAAGVWHPIDAVRMQDVPSAKTVDDLADHGGFDATHVAVLRSEPATERPFTDIVKPALDFMDGLSIEVIEPEAGAAAGQ